MARDECPVSDDAKANIEQAVGELHGAQFGDLRHKCAYCSYKTGFIDGYESAKRDITKRVNRSSPSEEW